MRRLWLATAIVGWAVGAAAQVPRAPMWLAGGVAQASVVDPTTVQFVPSADNSALTSEGLPVVVRYDLQFYLTNNLAVSVRTVALGKPSVGTDGTMQVDFSALTAWPLPDGTYQARVIAVGQKGAGASDPSNVFIFGPGTPSPPPTTTPPMRPIAVGIK